MAFIWRGKRLGRPQVASFVNDSALSFAPGTGAVAVGVVGVAERGQPNVALRFTDPATAREAYGGVLNTATPLADGVSRALAAGASVVYGVRIGPATQATADLTKTSTALITLKSKEWGLPANTWSVATAADVSGKKATLTIHDGSKFTIPNIARKGIKLQYNGDGTSPVVTINATSLVTAVSGSPTGTGHNNTLAFTTYGTLRSLAIALNNTGKWVATVTHPDDALHATGISSTKMLDFQTSTPVPTVASTNSVDLSTNVAAMAEAMASEWSKYVEVTLVTTDGPVDEETTLFAGATDSIPGSGATTQHYTDGLSKLQQVDTPLVVVMNDNDAVLASALEHCVLMSGVDQKKERIAVLGGGTGLSDSAMKTKAAALNSNRATFVGDAPKLANAAGITTVFPAYYLAATRAGQYARVGIAQALTREGLPILGIERVHLPTEIDDLLAGGVTAVEYDDATGSYRWAQDITTYLGAPNLVRQMTNSQRAADHAVRRVRDALDAVIVGKNGGPGLISSARQTLEAVFEDLRKEGILVAGEGKPAWTIHSITIVNDVLQVSAGCVVVIPTNYVTVDMNLSGFGS